MRAILCAAAGDASVLSLGEAPAPVLGAHDVRIRVRTTAVNRADLLQRRGLYPAPPGASPILGLECAGDVTELGPEAQGFATGDRVMALLSGGGYAEEVTVDSRCVLPVPAALSDSEAGGFMEAFLTAYSNLFVHGEIASGDSVLVHGGGSGIGTAATSLCKVAGVRVLVTAGNEEKCQRCRDHGADVAINYRTQDIARAVHDATSGVGVDAVLDCVGAPYFDANLASLKVGGRLLIIGLMGGARGEVSLAPLVSKRLRVVGSTLRSLDAEHRGRFVQGFVQQFGEALARGQLRPVVHAELPLAQAADAHRLVEAGQHFGKVVLRVA
jgi:putative PIG3 family NAD(P)H quinone oxidoreductase